MAVNFCSNCGAKLRSGAKFCGSCGQKIYSEEKKLPPMPYEKSKSVMEVYAEKKAEVKTQSKPVSIQEIFQNAKTNPQEHKKVTNMAEIYVETKKNFQVTQTAPWMKSSPQQSEHTPQPANYTSSHNGKFNYRKDTTIKEMFFSSEGRLNRQRYFNRTLLVVIAEIILMGIIFAVCSTPWGDVTRSGEALIGIVGVAALIPKYCLDVRRLKDIGKPFPYTKTEDSAENNIQLVAAMYAVLGLINMYFLNDWNPDSRIPMPSHAKAISSMATLFWLWMQCKAGMVGANRFGDDPLANER